MQRALNRLKGMAGGAMLGACIAGVLGQHDNLAQAFSAMFGSWAAALLDD